MIQRAFILFLGIVFMTGCGRVLTVPSPSAGNEANNGGGLGEKNVLTAFRDLLQSLDLCLSNPRCGLTREEEGWVNSILNQIKKEPPRLERLVFTSPRETTGLFRSDGLAHGAVRSAVTGGAWNGKIWINVDHLYQTGPRGVTEPIELPSASAILIDEFAHHVEPRFDRIEEHPKLDALCSKVRDFLVASKENLRECGSPEKVRKLIAARRVPGNQSIAFYGCLTAGESPFSEIPSEVEAVIDGQGHTRPNVISMVFRGNYAQDRAFEAMYAPSGHSITLQVSDYSDNVFLQGQFEVNFWYTLNEFELTVRDPQLVSGLRESLIRNLKRPIGDGGIVEADFLVCDSEMGCTADNSPRVLDESLPFYCKRPALIHAEGMPERTPKSGCRKFPVILIPAIFLLRPSPIFILNTLNSRNPRFCPIRRDRPRVVGLPCRVR